jgi:hypothetical protein
MKLKAFVLTAGLIALGANAAYAALPECTTNLDGQVRNSGNHCTSKSYKFNTWSKCTCPGDKANQTKKCVHNAIKPGETLKTKMYSCEVP